ncbi:Carnitine O-palmitoyltransferase 1, liver [Lamellibrachia satsuma]|nr:Carnitine O-palmitoyltransferase 1, liver [Lamellibrachia satsuma]
MADSIDLTVLHAPYSKGLMKKFRISPDGYLQMAVQLAYYRLHGEFVKTYEPSTGRLFALGRTETIHPISDDSKAWVHAMQPESTVDGAANIRLLKNAVSHQMSFRLSATQGHGCDRHLLGLYCASRELGMDIPKIFMDKAWRLPFKLSSSQTPTAVLSFKPDMDQKWWGGGFAPVCDEGYGVSYVFVGDENLNINITSWKSCKETDSTKFSKCLNEAMEDMKTLLSAK